MNVEGTQECCISEPVKQETKKANPIINDFYSAVARGEGPYSNDINRFSPSGPTEKIMEWLKKYNVQRVLDIGCGMGTTLLQAVQVHQEGKQFYGVDFSDDMLKKAKESKQNLPEDLIAKVGFFKGQAEQLPFMDEQFDFIYSECVFNLVSNKEQAVHEVSRLLAPGGIFVYTDFISYEQVPSYISSDEKLVCGCRTGSTTLNENIKTLELNHLNQIETFDFTEDNNKRFQELMEKSKTIRDEYHELQEQNQAAVSFLNEKMGYYCIKAIKQGEV
ncbi:putative arsinothricin biosynthesis methyltransferase ArsM [Bacillus alkalicellulosilyticus]|uniref:putative arsinothricin biosynthesis methyltransferase ArsM n=1 Tax=Alkalihalobacterium alkalicellulosilyticum TaxID=1912214 RepID=UPI000996A562|nr:putative arsinothricin biosynthesis methyltransferase ArsM [Bacillus alkalicellulosilyticus]